mmetsp:Transcript_24986/g.40544  ORF Transcript_24986/g.40544 Transcript_24986/m.40544 type:complete len:427 (+) Transcript_24986:212-1492(+)|eukprot:CAMPEP_0203767664 /NCGR_PEP_ID=MMETSP0099_2-20121227/1128_1 /ASSEMBLY_ACC=CAM_ASM_000209 /TAXON_ID=96639 /ORGANISM=" , Strain NY0313808BC1" /LENGTH=426 /DNA_ID=CAMNT_0050664209 /DNA_START=214 /DNA_END=1494 /DNA_ORIENTATION=+
METRKRKSKRKAILDLTDVVNNANKTKVTRKVLGDLSNQAVETRSCKPRLTKTNKHRNNRLPRSNKENNSPDWGENVNVRAAAGCPRGRHANPIPAGIEDIDMRHPSDPAYCFTYVKDIHSYYDSLQHKYPVEPKFLEKVQVNVDKKELVCADVRACVVDWLVEVAEEYMLLSDTLYLCIKYLDRVLSKVSISRSNMQLLGCACMLIAAKYEEQYAPQVDEIVIMAGCTYTKEEILRMEAKVLGELNFQLTCVTSKPFLRRFQRAASVMGTEKYLCNYLGELTLSRYEFATIRPDVVAAAAMYLARLTVYASDSDYKDAPRSPTFQSNADVWTGTLEHYTGFTPEDLALVIRQLNQLHKAATKYNGTQITHTDAVFDKYNSSAFERVATRVRPYNGRLLPPPGKTSVHIDELVQKTKVPAEKTNRF